MHPQTKRKTTRVLKWVIVISLIAGFIPSVPLPYWAGILIALFSFIAIVIIQIVIPNPDIDPLEHDPTRGQRNLECSHQRQESKNEQA